MPKKLDHDKIVADILKCYRIGMTKVTDVCSYAGCSTEWYYLELKKPYFAKVVENAKMQRKNRALNTIMKAAKKSWTAAAWFLERTYSDDFALKQRLEHSGIEAAAPITINVTPAEGQPSHNGSPKIESTNGHDRNKGH